MSVNFSLLRINNNVKNINGYLDQVAIFLVNYSVNSNSIHSIRSNPVASLQYFFIVTLPSPNRNQKKKYKQKITANTIYCGKIALPYLSVFYAFYARCILQY